MFRVIRYVIFTRWMRYLIAGIMLVCSVMVALSGIFAQQISQANGTLDTLTRFTDSKTGAYRDRCVPVRHLNPRWQRRAVPD
jgi:hypothetical protein